MGRKTKKKIPRPKGLEPLAAVKWTLPLHRVHAEEDDHSMPGQRADAGISFRKSVVALWNHGRHLQPLLVWQALQRQ